MSKMKQQLKDVVLAKSKSKILEEAVQEWSITGYYDCEHGETCVCGKEHIKSYSEIFNMITREVLTPIGCDCINHFGNEELNDDQKIYKRKSFVFNNNGGKHCGKTYGWICENDRKYIEFLISNHIVKERYKKLIKYFETVYLSKECSYEENKPPKIYYNVENVIKPAVSRLHVTGLTRFSSFQHASSKPVIIPTDYVGGRSPLD